MMRGPRSMMYASHTMLHLAIFSAGIVLGGSICFWLGMRAACHWWHGHQADGFRLLALVGRRRQVEGPDIQLAFDADREIREKKAELLRQLDPQREDGAA